MADLTVESPRSLQPCGWYGSIGDFFSIPKDTWLSSLQEYHQRHLLEPASASQISAWDSCYRVLQVELKKLSQTLSSFLNWTIIF